MNPELQLAILRECLREIKDTVDCYKPAKLYDDDFNPMDASGSNFDDCF